MTPQKTFVAKLPLILLRSFYQILSSVSFASILWDRNTTSSADLIVRTTVRSVGLFARSSPIPVDRCTLYTKRAGWMRGYAKEYGFVIKRDLMILFEPKEDRLKKGTSTGNQQLSKLLGGLVRSISVFNTWAFW